MNQDAETLQYCHGILPFFGIIAGRFAGNHESEWLRTDLIQIHHANVDPSFEPTTPRHAHSDSVECFVILEGSVTFEVEGQKLTLGRDTFLCVRAGAFHETLEVSSRSKFLTIRAPSKDDKVFYQERRRT